MMGLCLCAVLYCDLQHYAFVLCFTVTLCIIALINCDFIVLCFSVPCNTMPLCYVLL